MDRNEMAERIVAELNLRLNVPGLNEEQEAFAIRTVVFQVLPFLDDDVLELMADTSNGLNAVEIVRMSSMLSVVVNRYVNIPYVPEAYEGHVIQQILEQALRFAAEGLSLMEVGA